MSKKSLNSKVENGQVVITNKADYDEVRLTVEELENALNDAYQKSKSDIIAKAHCKDADCFECAFGSAEKCLLKED